MNCVSFLVNFGANVWTMDNELHMALDIAALENREDIVKFLDDAQSMQMRKSPKIAQELKEKAIRTAEKNAKHYEELQEKASRKLAKERRRTEQMATVQNGDFKPPSDGSVFKKLTLKLKGTKKLRSVDSSTTPQFSDIVQGVNKRGASQKHTSARNSAESDILPGDFRVSEMDESGKRTLKSVRGTALRKDAQVLYVKEDGTIDPSSRPPLANVFPGTALNRNGWNKSNSDPNLVDSGNDSFDDPGNVDDDDRKQGIFERPNFGNISFLNHFDHIESFKDKPVPAFNFDDIDSVLQNGELENGDDDLTVVKRLSSGTGSASTEENSVNDLPWKEDDVEVLDDDDEETEYTQVMVFLESCGLTRYLNKFTSNDVDMEALMKLTPGDLTEIGIPVGPRRKLLDALEKRKEVLDKPQRISDTYL